MLLWHNDNGLECLSCGACVSLLDGCSDIWPDVWRVVSIQVYDLLDDKVTVGLVLVVVGFAVESDGVQVVLVCFSSYYIDCLMNINFRVCCTIIITI